MDLTYKQEVGVGAMVLVGFAIFIAGMVWLTGRGIGGPGVETKVVFTNVSGLKQGDPVMVSGVKKGRVSNVDLERVGRVIVTLELSRDVRPRSDAGASIAALDLLGAKYVDYSPGAKEDELPDGSMIVGTTPEDVAKIFAGVGIRAQELIGNATTLVSDRLGQDLHNTLVAMQRAMNAMADVGGGPLFKQTTQTLAATEQMMRRVDSIVASGTGQRVDTLATNLARLTNHLGTASAALDSLLRKMNRGEGSLGMLASDTLLYHNLNATLDALTKLMTDLRERPGRYLTVKVF